MSRFTAHQVCNIVSNDDPNDPEFLFDGSDDDLGMSDEEELLQDCPDEEDYDPTMIDTTMLALKDSSATPGTPHSTPSRSRTSSFSPPRIRSQSPSVSPSRSRSQSPIRGRGQSRGSRRRGRGRGRGHGRSAASRQGGTTQAADGDEQQWSETVTDITVNEFTESVGPTFPLSSEPVDAFLELFPEQLINVIVTETNRYAAECLLASHNGDGPPPTWETNAEEIKAFLGFSILMGVNVLPDIYDYWSLQESFHYFPIASRISRKQFLEIRRYLHFVDNSSLAQRGEPGYDRLGKIRPIIDAVNTALLTSHKPNCENSIDKAMIKFKGRSSLKQYVPLKSVKRGIKAWVRADAKNGIMCELSVYTGKKNDQPGTNLGAKVVKRLTRNIAGRNHHIYCDNYFTSVPLFEELLEEDSTYAGGTFRRDRKGIPKDIKNTGKQYNTPKHIFKLYTLTTQHACTCPVLFICLYVEFLAL